MKRTLLSIFVLSVLSACGNTGHDDLKQWMAAEEMKLAGKIDVIPPAKTFKPVQFNATIDPFVVKEKVTLADLNKDKYAPDLSRPKDELEGEQLESLRMVGTVIKDGKFYSMIKDKNRLIHYVAIGNHLGTNFGEIKDINEGEMIIEERVKEVDEWKLKTSKIYLYEGK